MNVKKIKKMLIALISLWAMNAVADKGNEPKYDPSRCDQACYVKASRIMGMAYKYGELCLRKPRKI